MSMPQSEPRMPMDENGRSLTLGEKLFGHGAVTGVRWPIGICLACGSRVVNIETGEGHGEHRGAAALPAQPAEPLDVERLATNEHTTDADDPLACWCRPYRDAECPDVIIHREEGEA